MSDGWGRFSFPGADGNSSEREEERAVVVLEEDGPLDRLRTSKVFMAFSTKLSSLLLVMMLSLSSSSPSSSQPSKCSFT